MTEFRQPNQLVEQRKAHIKDLGFNQIGKTSLYKVRDGRMVIGINPQSGKYIFLVDYDKEIFPPQVSALKVADYSGTSALHLFSGDRFLMPCVQGGVLPESQRDAREEMAKLTQLSSTPLVEQLTQAGFVEDMQNPGAWQRNFLCQYEGGPQEVVVLVEDGSLSHILKPLAPSKYKSYEIDKTTEIFSVKREKGFMGGPQDVLTLHRNFTSLDLSTDLGGSIDNVQPTREILPEEINIEVFSSHSDTSTSDFIVGGVNSTELIRSLKALNGRTIAEMEIDMRPTKGGNSYETSTAGFLGQDELLLDVMAEDNDFVQSLGLTHQDMAFPLKYIRRFYKLNYGKKREISGIKDIFFTFRGNDYHMVTTQHLGPQGSPFRDDTAATSIFTIENLTNGESLGGSLLYADMIERWGFYEGKGTTYRLEPEAILKVFPHLQKLSQERLAK